ncbi:hypothetical protein NQ315_002550 [Exocentrus adspersus]|uniref:RNase H type-1 domain-containing protein n=1 Tax=Exocentrus adspersus TaxID=1586481 RepID=A0AAV8VF33_9CUCU|nr:hypothetical protein NQ315_002550 [Exocentrus adspersus]
MLFLGLPSLSTWIVKEAMAAYLRIRDAGSWKAKGRAEGHAAIALRAESEVPLSAMKVTEAEDRLRLKRSYSTTFPTREQWKQEGNMFPPGSLVCYTDGSRMRDEYSGAGIYLENSGAQQSYSLGSYATVFQAEVFAILMTAHREDVRNCAEERIFICSDSQAALRAVSSPRTRSILVQECGDALESLAGQREVELVWVPGHMGIPGNERADQLARLGSGQPCQGPEPILGITRGSIRAVLSKWRNLNQMVGILTGHCRLRRHLYLIGIEESPLCLKCGEGEDTPTYFLGQCVAFGRLRHKVFGTGELQREKITGLPWTKILTFVRASGRFEKANRRTVDR